MKDRAELTDEYVQRLLEVFHSLNQVNVWCRVQKGDFTMKRFEAGFVNDIICCELTEEARGRLCKKETDCPAVVVKFVNDLELFQTISWESTAIQTLISNHELGPKLLYIDDKCQINEYVNSRNHNEQDNYNDELERKFAQKLARFHSLKPPISHRATKHFMDNFTDLRNLDKTGLVLNKSYLKMLKENSKFTDKFYPILEKIDLVSFFDESLHLMLQTNSPIRFIHGDFHHNNRLIQSTVDENGNKSQEVFFVDFDLCNYTYRGFDLGRYFYTFKHAADPEESANQLFPQDEELKVFLTEYRNESARLSSSPDYFADPINSMEQLIRETKIFGLHSYLFDIWCTFHLYCKNPDNESTETILNYSVTRINQYSELRQRLIDTGVVKLD